MNIQNDLDNKGYRAFTSDLKGWIDIQKGNNTVASIKESELKGKTQEERLEFILNSISNEK